MNQAKGLKVFAAYITRVRDKYVFETGFIGVFTNYDDALRAIFSCLVSEGMVLNPETLDDIAENDMDHILTIFKDEKSWEEYNIDYDEFPFHLLNPNKKLEDIIKENNDSYYLLGWDYTIESAIVR